MDGLPLFGPFWDAPPSCRRPVGSRRSSSLDAVTASEIAERDLSVQLSGWMLMEAAYAVTVNEKGSRNE